MRGDGGGLVDRLLQGALSGEGVGLLLRLADVLLVADAFVAEPVGNLSQRKDWQSLKEHMKCGGC